jgi:hypothetical protein
MKKVGGFMAQKLFIEDNLGLISDVLNKTFQSSNINFLIGSGCSVKDIPILGSIENEITQLENENHYDEAEHKMFGYLNPFISTLAKVTTKGDCKSTKLYFDFLKILYQILNNRKSNILPKRISVFSTNYDLFIEKAFEGLDTELILCDGFNRTPSLTNCFKFSTTEFKNSFFNTGNLYNYKVELPAINLIKIHGSMSWKSINNEIYFHIDNPSELRRTYNKIKKVNNADEIKKFNSGFSIILPRKEKFKDTLLNQTYYDLLRYYTNELEKENTILIVIGFSFSDEHIREITWRALKNPTLLIFIFSYSQGGNAELESHFSKNQNVLIVSSQKGNLDFSKSIELMNNIVSP